MKKKTLRILVETLHDDVGLLATQLADARQRIETLEQQVSALRSERTVTGYPLCSSVFFPTVGEYRAGQSPEHSPKED